MDIKYYDDSRTGCSQSWRSSKQRDSAKYAYTRLLVEMDKCSLGQPKMKNYYTF